MDAFDVLSLIWGLCLFLFGMNIMSDSLERSAGNKLKSILETLTKNKWMGFITGLVTTAIIQSSSATTVMVVGFVNSGIITLRQSIGVIMGANIGTTVTAWILSLCGISSDNVLLQMFKPTSFVPILAVAGIAMLMFCKTSKRKDIGTVLLGFATLMFGMDAMSGAVEGISEIPAFRNMFLAFSNPILGILVGMFVTAIIQSSSASVGILQALSVTGQVSYGAVIPIIMGQNIGTCITALLSSIGTSKNAKRAAVIHLSFNIIGSVILIVVFLIIKSIFEPAILNSAASTFGIAVAHSLFNLLCTAMLLPMSGLLEKIAVWVIPDTSLNEKNTELDERLLTTPAIAIERCDKLLSEMLEDTAAAFGESIALINNYTDAKDEYVREIEKKSDHYEDIIGSYLVKLSRRKVSDADSVNISKLLKIIGEAERISDLSVKLADAAQELNNKKIKLSDAARDEMEVLCSAVSEILTLTCQTYADNDLAVAMKIKPLEDVIDRIRDMLRDNHIKRLKNGECSIEAGFIWSDMLNSLERASDHCSNIAVCVLDSSEGGIGFHEAMHNIKTGNENFNSEYQVYKRKYIADLT